jgi:hypothetical protein
MSYKIYKDKLDSIKENAKGKKLIKLNFGKANINYKEYASFILNKFPKNSNEHKKISKLISEEQNWHDCGSPVIFLDDISLINSLYIAEFDFENNFNVEPPFKTFSMSFPKDTIIEGVEIPSCLVTIMTRKEFIDLYGSEITHKDRLDEEHDNDELCISIAYETDTKRTNTNFTHLSTYTKTKQSNFSKRMQSMGTERLSILTKIALTMCVYNSATNGKKLVKGYPTSSIVMPKDKNRVSYNGLTISADREKQQTKETRKIKHRIPFYRNLVADRYYKGEYESLKRGSRWILVKEIDLDNSMNTLLS